nr:MAG TPA: hypothetical protein [Caudoviricetes sp.]
MSGLVLIFLVVRRFFLDFLSFLRSVSKKLIAKIDRTFA